MHGLVQLVFKKYNDHVKKMWISDGSNRIFPDVGNHLIIRHSGNLGWGGVVTPGSPRPIEAPSGSASDVDYIEIKWICNDIYRFYIELTKAS